MVPRSQVNRFNGFWPCLSTGAKQTSLMSLHSYSRVWLHLVWATLERRPLLSKPAAAQFSAYLHQYASEKGIYMKINYVNPEHVHALVDLPTKMPIEDMMQLFKGGSSHWINQNALLVESSPGAAATEFSRCRIPVFPRQQSTLPARKSTIGSAASRKSSDYWSSGMD